VAGSRAAFVTDIIDVDPVRWNLVFSRFCNENRVEIGDVDIDTPDAYRPLIYDHIFESFGAVTDNAEPVHVDVFLFSFFLT
jgi:DNA polymerase III subunit alpha